MLDYMDKTDYHLFLPQLLYGDNNAAYENKFNELCQSPDDYVILDNGLAEGYNASDEQMLALAATYRPDEIVIPDVMGDFTKNTSRALTFLDSFGTFFAGDEDYVPKLMFVAQGKSTFEFQASIAWALGVSEITAIGIPRHTLETTNDLNARISLANFAQLMPGFDREIHFLGASPLWSSEMKDLADSTKTMQKHVRGMDTSMPFVYAHALAYVDEDYSVHRPPGYFNMTAGRFSSEYVDHNVDLMLEWCSAE